MPSKGVVRAVALSFIAFGGTIGLTATAAPAHALCATPIGTANQQLRAEAKAGDRVFIGTVVGRGAARVLVNGSERRTVTPLTFRVAAFLHGHPARQIVVFVLGGTINRITEAIEDEPSYEGSGLQLVQADATPSRALVSRTQCSGAGSVSTGTAKKLVAAASHPVVYDARFATPRRVEPRLPDTGPGDLIGLLSLAGGTILVGAVAWGGALMRREAR